MQEQGENMKDVRGRLGIRAAESKVEKRMLERIGHIMRMGDKKLTKAVVLTFGMVRGFGWERK